MTFSEVNGLPGLNDKKPRRIQNVKVKLPLALILLHGLSMTH